MIIIRNSLITVQPVDIDLNEPTEIHELIKLVIQSFQQVKGALVVEASKITIIVMKAKYKFCFSKYRNKRRSKKCYVWLERDISKVENTSRPANIGPQYVSRTSPSNVPRTPPKDPI